MTISEKNNNIILKDVKCLDVGLSLDCGQAFRFSKKSDNTFHGVAFGQVLDVKQENQEITFYHTDRKTFEEIWMPFFDLARDYEKIVSGFDDKFIKKAVKEYYGIRILKQEPWEALCSFIISQNNNIPRIKGIIHRLCENFGDKLNEEDYTFPSFEVLFNKNIQDLEPLRAGFRAKYILDACRKVKSGEVDLYNLSNMTISEAKSELLKIKGVGEKVADCTLLYGLGFIDAFPIDVWVRRICEELYPEGLPECMNGVKGIAQQYLFHWRRNLRDVEEVKL